MNTFTKMLRHTDLMVGFGLLLVVGMLIMPLPHFILDLGLVMAIGASILILLTAVNVDEPLQFSVFPSLLLITTLFRLALSIVAVKLILGTGEGGQVITTFGNFVLGGNIVVGFVAFLILMIVQFVVITNGATRVSEVVARFTLDAMPGKQMAIDADLAAGLIDEGQARARRKAIKQEADFYGSMDGASKFVKGDAIASILIVVVNLLGGIVMGMVNGQGSIGEVAQQYAILTVGEGLVSQIPALLVSTSAGLLVTRNGQEAGMGGTVFGQVLSRPRVFMATAVAMAVFAFVPGFPTIIFLLIAGLMAALSQFSKNNPDIISALLTPKVKEEDIPKPEEPQGPPPGSPDAVLPLLSVDALEIEVGYSLTKLADARVGGDLPERIATSRAQLATDMGFVMPSVRIRDNAMLDPNEYVIKVRGEEVARARCFPDELLCILPGYPISGITGTAAKDPVFGLDALWIDEGQRSAAEQQGCTVVEPPAALATHLGEVVKTYSAELLTRQDVQRLLDNLKQTHEAVVTALGAEALPLGDVQKVLQHLLRERIPIRDLVTILETVADYGSRVKDTDQLGELVRAAISRTITRQFSNPDLKLTCITLSAATERVLQESIQQTTAGPVIAIEPERQRQFLEELEQSYIRAQDEGHTPVLLCGAALRLAMRRLLDRHLPALPVVAYNEVAAQADVEFVSQIQSLAQTAA
jgi:flagellar biosynthesis protein FlhA